ncbi:MAG: thiamine phosphate synthase [Acidobacteriaceae bacterium]|nr:thiamine phosphate synthase [Acidobacteriaceae bacterium]
MVVSQLYAIADVQVLAARGIALADFARELRAADVGLVQYRNKNGSPQEVLRGAATLREAMAGSGCKLIMNDRADLAVLAGFDGVHVGQGDLSPEEARRIVGPDAIVGISTHSEEQVRAADPASQDRDVRHPVGGVDYIAIGPVFSTGTKLDAAPVVGLEGVRRARALTAKPLVAIGGITRANARSVIEAGADSIAIISALFAADESVEQVARDFLARLR